MGNREPSISIKAYAKINLGLDITGRNEEGYHDLKTVMQQIELCDVINLYAEAEISGSGEPGQILISCDDSLIPADETNLAYKAARLLFDEFEITDSLLIEIEKNIPMTAGLAGGSTDAAAVLKGVNEYFGLGLSAEELMTRGKTLGADVPFCIMGGTAYAEGIGEKLIPLGALDELTVLVAVPDTRVSTKWAYANYDKVALRGGTPGYRSAESSHRDGGFRLCTGVSRKCTGVCDHTGVSDHCQGKGDHDEKRCGRGADERFRPQRLRVVRG